MATDISGLNTQSQSLLTPTYDSQSSNLASVKAGNVQGQLNHSTQSVQAAEQTQNAEVDMETLTDAVEKMNELMRSSNRSLEFSVDDSTENVVIKVMDRDTDEVIRQIPSEETLKFSEFLEGMAGMIFDEKA